MLFHTWPFFIFMLVVLPVFLALACVPMFTLSDVQDGIGRGQAWMWAALLPPTATPAPSAGREPSA